MSKIALTGGFTPIPEGHHVFKITEVTYKEEYGKLEVKMVNANGRHHTERFGLLRADGSSNSGAYSAFSFLARAALDNDNLTEVEHEDLVGRYFSADVVHDVQESKTKPGETVTFIKLNDKRPASGFDGEAPKAAPAFSLDSLLG